MTKQTTSNHRYAASFSLVGSALIILFFALVNLFSGARFPWAIYPIFAVLWWPMGVILGRKPKALSVAGSLAIIALLFLTNYLTTPATPWFLYPTFAVLWWPLALFFGARGAKPFSVIGFLLLSGFAAIVNEITTPGILWFHYVIFAASLWPLGVFLGNPKTQKAFSVLGALYIFAFCAADNLIHLPGTLWVLFTVYPLILWPVCVFAGEKVCKAPYAAVLAGVGILYYALLNGFLFTGFPWALCTAYALLWWPLGAAFAGRGQSLAFAVCGAGLSAAFFIWLNFATTPQVIWAVYPIFALLWWPLAVYYFVYKPRKRKQASQQ